MQPDLDAVVVPLGAAGLSAVAASLAAPIEDRGDGKVVLDIGTEPAVSIAVAVLVRTPLIVGLGFFIRVSV
jgi:hypothetical protein